MDPDSGPITRTQVVDHPGPSLPKPKKWDEEIVISGISGRYPECESIKEFWDKLSAGIELISSDERRWPIGEYPSDFFLLFLYSLFRVYSCVCATFVPKRFHSPPVILISLRMSCVSSIFLDLIRGTSYSLLQETEPSSSLSPYLMVLDGLHLSSSSSRASLFFGATSEM